MRIETKNMMLFGILKSGDCFKAEEHIYMKVNDPTYNCVNLETGDLRSYSDEYCVMTLDAKILIN